MLTQRFRELSLRIAVVEHSESLRASLVTTIEQWTGTEVKGFRDTKEFEQRPSQEPPDVLVLDMDTPGGNSLDDCRSLRRANPLMILIAIGSSGHSSKKADAMNAGADNYHLKPVIVPELLSNIHSLARWLKKDLL